MKFFFAYKKAKYSNIKIKNTITKEIVCKKDTALLVIIMCSHKRFIPWNSIICGQIINKKSQLISSVYECLFKYVPIPISNSICFTTIRLFKFGRSTNALYSANKCGSAKHKRKTVLLCYVWVVNMFVCAVNVIEKFLLQKIYIKKENQTCEKPL